MQPVAHLDGFKDLRAVSVHRWWCGADGVTELDVVQWPLQQQLNRSKRQRCTSGTSRFFQEGRCERKGKMQISISKGWCCYPGASGLLLKQQVMLVVVCGHRALSAHPLRQKQKACVRQDCMRADVPFSRHRVSP